MPTQKVEIVLAHEEVSQRANAFPVGDVVICTKSEHGKWLGCAAVIGFQQVVMLGDTSGWVPPVNFGKSEFRRLRPGERVTVTRE